MKKLLTLFVLMVLLIGCSSQIKQNASENSTQNINTANSEADNNVKNDKTSVAYVGCWSAGNRDVTLIRITENTIQTTYDKARVFNYKNITTNSDKDAVYLEIEGSEKMIFFRKFLQITPFKFSETDNDYEAIQIRGSKSLENLRSGDYGSRLNVVREDCEKIKSWFDTEK